MWAHYADSHAGVCLVLDHLAVNDALDEGLCPTSTRYRMTGRIKYVDERIRIPLAGTFADQADLDDAIEAFLDTNRQIPVLYMTKNTDWAYEKEFRIAVVELDLPDDEFDSPVYIPLGESLKAVIFGQEYPDPGPMADEIRTVLGADAPELFRCCWDAGAPSLEELT